MNRFAVLAMVVAFQVIHQANAKAVFAHFMVPPSSLNFPVEMSEKDTNSIQGHKLWELHCFRLAVRHRTGHGCPH